MIPRSSQESWELVSCLKFTVWYSHKRTKKRTQRKFIFFPDQFCLLAFYPQKNVHGHVITVIQMRHCRSSSPEADKLLKTIHFSSPIPSFSRDIFNLLQSGNFCHAASAGSRLGVLCAPSSSEISFSTFLPQQLQWIGLRFFYNYNTLEKRTAGQSKGIQPEESTDVLNKIYDN